MRIKWLRLAAGFLEQASDVFANHGCNDWNFPDDWTEEEKQEFVRAMHTQNGSPERYDSAHLTVPDWWVMSFLASALLTETEESEETGI